VELLQATGKILQHWLDLLDGKKLLEIDWQA
jgi:hypothetical protein